MNRTILAAALLGTVSVAFATNPAPVAPAPLAAAAFHCQVPCGVYGDRMRIDMLLEDCTTIEKGMTKISEMESADSFAHNQMVRWIMNKDAHSAAIQEQVASYWLAQRIKAPRDGDADAAEKYVTQLTLMHGLTVAAMKCKQTTDTANVEQLRALSGQFAATYFSEEDLKHLESHR